MLTGCPDKLRNRLFRRFAGSQCMHYAAQVYSVSKSHLSTNVFMNRYLKPTCCSHINRGQEQEQEQDTLYAFVRQYTWMRAYTRTEYGGCRMSMQSGIRFVRLLPNPTSRGGTVFRRGNNIIIMTIASRVGFLLISRQIVLRHAGYQLWT